MSIKIVIATFVRLFMLYLLIFSLLIYINTAITDEINDLDQQRISIEEKREILKKLEQYELRQQ